MLTMTISIYICLKLELGGIETIICAAVISISPNIGASNQTLKYRFYGILVGWFLGLIISILNLHFQSLTLILILFGITIFSLTRISLLYPKYSYICAQAGLLLVLMLVTGYSSSAFGESFQRLLGVFIGGSVAIFILLIIRPKKPSIELTNQIRIITLEQLFFLSFLPLKLYKPRGEQFKSLDEKIKNAELSVADKGNLNESTVIDKRILKILNDIQLHLKIISRILNTSHAIKQKVTSEVYRSLMQIKLSDLNSIHKIQSDNYCNNDNILFLRLVNIKYNLDKIIDMRKQLYKELSL